MGSLLVLMVTVVSLGWTIVSSAEMEESTLASSSQIEGSAEYDSESARKIIGSRWAEWMQLNFRLNIWHKSHKMRKIEHLRLIHRHIQTILNFLERAQRAI